MCPSSWFGPIARVSLISFSLAALSCSAEAGTRAKADDEKVLQVGMAKSFFTDMPRFFVGVFETEFKKVLKKTIGLDGELQSKHDAHDCVKKLDRGELDFVLVHGHEYAWLQKKYPELKPLVVARGKHPVASAHVIVRKDSPIRDVADLRGKKLDIPIGSKGHCRFFVESVCSRGAQAPLTEFFGSVENSISPRAALDGVSQNKTQAAVVDETALELYKQVKGPVFAKHLRILCESEAFPQPVLLYKSGAVDSAILKRVCDGMLNAHKTEFGRSLLRLADLERFEPVSKEYEKQVEESRSHHPAPVSFEKSVHNQAQN